MKLALGTVQFGLAYGIANPQPQISFAESKAVVDYAAAQGMTVLDTAMGYGESEARLGEIGVDAWKVISKLPEVPDGGNAAAWINSAVKSSLEKLKIDSLYGLLLHRPAQLLGGNGTEIYAALQRLKADGLVEKIGVSIYQPSELEGVFSVGEFDLVQSPLSVLDRRLITSGWLDRLADRGVEVHARSVFLQGLLLMSADQRPGKFARWAGLWDCYHAWVAASGLSPLEANLAYVSAIPEVQHVVVGVNGLIHIKEILSARTDNGPDWSTDLATEDEELLNPLAWLQL
ncbi:aldo/keto reductase [Rhodoferax sp. TS-BS-61-7]|uniref:aldo/keto reductase n=1 Tax=Rhodoferax sp. TS-BS-61-7 TaxID=2094194 RepID=UPI000CF68EC4|nr:aldo/keto reductase [Rhodoferax sp. TS-BS-61-7]PQA76607.1 aldo/keto reductase [Rhodoferax sp. TS-BS-61-7]